jgi:hypothetical protein
MAAIFLSDQNGMKTFVTWCHQLASVIHSSVCCL